MLWEGELFSIMVCRILIVVYRSNNNYLNALLSSMSVILVVCYLVVLYRSNNNYLSVLLSSMYVIILFSSPCVFVCVYELKCTENVM